MSASTQLVHYFDTTRHTVACGSPGFTEHSTKHSRSVTCPACLALLRARNVPTQASAPAGDASHAW